MHLIQTCLDDACAQGKHGVVTVATERVWMAKKDIFLKHGFVDVAQAPPLFHLLVYRFDDSGASAAAAPLPAFPTDWEARQARFGAGLTVIRTPQCPYVEDATNIALEFAAENGIPTRVATFRSAQELQAHSPSPYGVFGIVLDGNLLAYHYLQRKDFDAYATRIDPHTTCGELPVVSFLW